MLCKRKQQHILPIFNAFSAGSGSVMDTSAAVLPCPEIIELFPCSTQLSMKFSLLINVKMPLFNNYQFDKYNI